MIRIEGLQKTLGGQPVLRGVDLEVAAGEIVAVVGPSGTGKSVLLKHIIGLLAPDAGDVHVAGESVAHADFRKLARLRTRMGYVFQDAALLDSLSVRDNLRLALSDEACAKNPLHAPMHIAEALRTVRLDERVLDRLPGQLSGGMRKRVGVARAIINRPDVLLYDEPTTGLDPANVAAVNELIVRARDDLGATSLFITHDLATLPAIADRVCFLTEGTVRFLGAPHDFLTSDDASVTAFTGRHGPTITKEEATWPDMRVATKR
jgi:phospholipid/cholesterol/gamma-HCH transport system ATP-binding protein